MFGDVPMYMGCAVVCGIILIGHEVVSITDERYYRSSIYSNSPGLSVNNSRNSSLMAPSIKSTSNSTTVSSDGSKKRTKKNQTYYFPILILAPTLNINKYIIMKCVRLKKSVNQEKIFQKM